MIEASDKEIVNPANVFSAKYPEQVNERWLVEVISTSGLVKLFQFTNQTAALTFYQLLAKHSTR